MERPNVLLIVWDACRLDAAREHAPTLRGLAEDNLWFENAVTPAGTSLGSHVSMFTGEYPHEHGVYEQTDLIEAPLPLVRELGRQGYDCYGVSANGFAAPKYGFDRGFDEFYNTQGLTVFPKGLDVHRYARKVRERSAGEFSLDRVSYADLAREVATHDHGLRSLANVVAAGVSELSGSYPALRRIPHPRFDRFNEFCYDPGQNTTLIAELFERATGREPPFFLFANYMDAHHPYAPAKRFQREYCDRTFSYRELSRIADRTHPFEYLLSVERGEEPTGEELEAIRGLYRGEVRSADEHLSRVLAALEAHGLREETLVVVTADHGENLGERNGMGERHFGHVCSAGDNHLRVPLVIAHPDLDGERIDDLVSTKNIYDVLTEGGTTVLERGSDDVDALRTECPSTEVPITGGDVLRERYPELGVLDRDLVATYVDDWKVVVGSDGSACAWKDGEHRPVGDAPAVALETGQERLDGLKREGRGDVSDADESHLEALGYL